MADFDPYHKWLGIPPKDQPADHYRLLGIERFESDGDVIEAAADQRMGHVRNYQTGQSSSLSQKLLNELAAAKLCLLDPERKKAYDAKLQAELPKPTAPSTKRVIDEPSASVVPLAGLDVAPSPRDLARLSSRRATPVAKTRTRPNWRWPAMAGGGVVLLAALAVWFSSAGFREAPDNPDARRNGGRTLREQASTDPQKLESQSRDRQTATIAAGPGPPAANPDAMPGGDRQIAEEVLRRGGTVTVTSAGKRTTVDQLNALPASDLEVVEVRLMHADAAKVADLEFLARAKRLDVLSLFGSPITASSLVPFAGHPTLRDLNLEETRLPSGSIKAAVPLPNLEALLLAVCEVGRRDLVDITALKKLRTLGLQGAKLNDEDMALLEEIPALEGIYLYAVPITDAGLAMVARAAPLLRLLVISATKITDDGLRNLTVLKHLKQLDIAGNPQLTGRGLQWLAEMPSLEQIKLDQTSITDDSLAALAALPALKTLLLSGTAIGDAGLKRLSSLGTLEYINLTNTRVTAPAIEEFRQALPNCRIVADPAPQVAAAKPSAASSDTIEPGQPPVVEKPPDSAARPSIPEGDIMESAKKLVHDTYRDELDDADPAAAVRLLLSAASETTNDLAAQAALLSTAVEIASDAGDLRLAFESLDELGRRFKFDALAAKVAALETAAKSVRDNKRRAALVNRALELMDENQEARRFDLAERSAKVGASLAARLKDAELRKAIAAKRKSLDKQQKSHESRARELAAARRTLANNPDDRASNEIVGTCLIVDQNDWTAGLPHLAKARQPKLQAAAQADLAGAPEPQQQVAIGDRWWDLADSADASDARAFRSRAVHWYSQAVARLSGLSRAKVDKRIKEAGELRVAGQESLRGKHADISLAPGVALRLIQIPASADGAVKSFWLGETEVTEAQWAVVMGGIAKDAALPKGDLGFDDCRNFLVRAGDFTTRFVLRIPTESELRHASLAGQSVESWFQEVDDHVWYKENSRNRLQPVATKRPNPFGVYDLVGNCWEWCDKSRLFGDSSDTPRDRLKNGPGVSGDETGNRNWASGLRIAGDLR